MAEPALELDQLSVARAGRTVVTEAALTVAPGEVLALLGANGAGKSSLIGAVSGALASAGGRVLLGGQDITGLGADRRARIGLGLVPEGRRVFAGLTVRENLDVACHDADRRAGRLADCLTLFPDLAEHLDRRAWQLSGGQQQMLAIARALMGGPRVLLLDEPSLGLAPLLVTAVMRQVRAVADAGAAVLLAEQNARAALSVADRVALLQAGRIVRTGTPQEFSDDAALLSEFL